MCQHLKAEYGSTGYGYETCSLFTLPNVFDVSFDQVWSRFVTVEREGRALKAMAPVFDMFNHDPASSTVHGYQETNHCLHLVTLQDWQAGSEVRLSYGTLPNSRLLLLHGFCLPDNAFDAVELWATMEERAPYYDTKTKVVLRSKGQD